MDDMREIVTSEQVDQWFPILAVAAPIVGLLIGAVLGARRGQAGRGAVKGLLGGMVGPLNLLLWKLYNTLTDRMGLDSVRNLLVQLGLFVALGVISGLILGYLVRRRGDSPDNTGMSPVGAGVGPAPTARAGAAKRLEEADERPRDG